MEWPKSTLQTRLFCRLAKENWPKLTAISGTIVTFWLFVKHYNSGGFGGGHGHGKPGPGGGDSSGGGNPGEGLMVNLAIFTLD